MSIRLRILCVLVILLHAIVDTTNTPLSLSEIARSKVLIEQKILNSNVHVQPVTELPPLK